MRSIYPDPVELEFSGEIWFWRGPSPYHYVTVPEPECVELEAASRLVTYGWGMIPVAAQIGETQWTTSLFPKDRVRKGEQLEIGDVVTIRLTLDV